MGTGYQPFDRRQQPARHQPGDRRCQQGGQGDNHPTGASLLLIETDVGITCQPLYGRRNYPADDFIVVADRMTRALLRYRAGMPHQPVVLAVHHPKLGAPAFGRQIVAAVAVLFERTHDLVNHLIVIAQKNPVTVTTVLFFQCFAQHVDALLVAVFDVVDKTALEADANAPMHGNEHQHAGGENGHEQLAGDAYFHYCNLVEPVPGSLVSVRLGAVSAGTRAKASAGSAMINAMQQ